MKKILVETSARHVHVTREALDILFGKDFNLSIKKELSQPGQYASNTKLIIEGPKGRLVASILGPERKFNQVEISATEARTIGIKAPIRESGDIKGSAPIRIINPNDESKFIDLEEGCIIAKRHIHMTEEDAKEFGVKNGDIVGVKINNTGRSLIFEDTVCRVSNNFSLAMHIDTDECNASNAIGEVFGELIK